MTNKYLDQSLQCNFAAFEKFFGGSFAESLKLHMSYFVGADDVISFHVLLSGCPILEALYISFPSEIFHNIHLPLPPYLKRLEFTVHSSIGACLEILDAPGLKKLTLNRITFSTIGDLHNVLEANLDVS
jgi:hypothetical protein